MARLPSTFYARPAPSVAVELLGKLLVRSLEGCTITARIVETEAYIGQTDPGSHAYRGRTPRTEVMFGPPGRLYVYFTYGMHFCMNVVTDSDGVAGAVLLRAAEPLFGIDLMQEARGARPLVELCNGPAKLCQAFRVGKHQNGADLSDSDVWLEDDGCKIPGYDTTTRVGLSAGRDLQLRFYVPGNPHVSRGRPSVPLVS